jgi:predicted enzyme related to lactoylglutathione lyase
MGEAQLAEFQVGIVVRDIEAVTPFYREGLGLQHHSDFRPPAGLMRFFACNGGTLKLIQLAETPTAANPPGGIGGGATGLRWFTLAVPDLEDTLQRCEAAGARVVQPIREWQPGIKLMILEDPESNCWVEIAERPATREG